MAKKDNAVSLKAYRALDKVQNRERPKFTEAELKRLCGSADTEITELNDLLGKLRTYANDLTRYSESPLVCEAISREARNVLEATRIPLAKLSSLFDRKAAKGGEQ